MDFADLEAVYRKWLHLEHDPHILRLIYSILLANKYDGSPVWAFVVGPAGAGKTELLMSMSSSQEVIAVSTLTPYALASGYGDGSDSLLHRLHRHTLIVEDISAVTELPKEARSTLFSFLRSAYNGQFTRVTGKNTIEWKGKFGFLAGGTLALEKTNAMESSLGERFLTLRMRFGNGAERKIMRAARESAMTSSKRREELRAAARNFLDAVYIDPSNRKLHGSLLSTIEEASIVLSRARSGVLRDRYSKELLFPVETDEMGTRLQSQFIALSLAARAIGTDWTFITEMLYRVMLDSIPYIRLRILRSVHTGHEDSKAITDDLGMSKSVVKRHLQEMQMLKLLSVDGRMNYAIKRQTLIDALNVVG